ncbi:MAG TPA: hypothetical protein VGL94_00140 [Ktedonobacteraceae bacterium]|jgi:hypothetical protein
MNQSAYTEHMAEILYRKLTYEEEYLPGQNLVLTSDSVFEALCEIVKQLSDIPGLRERIEKLS